MLIRLCHKCLQKPTIVQFLKFGVVGTVGFLVDFALTYFGIYVLGMERIAAGFFAFPFAVTATWIGNRLYTYADKEHEPMAKQWSKFAAVCAVGIVFNRGTYSLLVGTLPLVYEHPVLGLIAGSCAGLVFNFLAASKLVFK